MATLFSDSFNRADSTDLGPAWTEVKGNHQIASNGLQVAAFNSVNNFADCRADTDAHAAVADCRVTVRRVSGTAFDGGVYARASGTDATVTAYVLNIYGSNNIDVYRFDAGASTLIGSRNQLHSDGDTYSLEVSGTGATVTLKVFRNGSQIGANLTDTSGSRITAAGQTGVISWSSSVTVYDEFLVEDLATGAGTATPAMAALIAVGQAPSVNPFTTIRIREVLINEAGSPVGNASGINLLVWFADSASGAPDLSYSSLTTDTNGTTSWSIATGSLRYNDPVFFLAYGGGSPPTSFAAGRIFPNYEP